MVKIVTPGQKARSAVFTPIGPGDRFQKKMMDGPANASGSDAVLRTVLPGHGN
jgi:hypothetical protein